MRDALRCNVMTTLMVSMTHQGLHGYRLRTPLFQQALGRKYLTCIPTSPVLVALPKKQQT